MSVTTILSFLHCRAKNILSIASAVGLLCIFSLQMQDIAVRLNWCYRGWIRSCFRRMCWRCKRHGWLEGMHSWRCGLYQHGRRWIEVAETAAEGGGVFIVCSRLRQYCKRKLHSRWMALPRAVMKEGRCHSLRALLLRSPEKMILLLMALQAWALVDH